MATPTRIRLQARPRVVDEGELVEFVADARAVDGDVGAPVDARYEWNFGDGGRPTTGVELSAVAHRFADGAADATTHLVTARVGRSTATVPVVVRNVAPRIRNARRSQRAQAGQPVTFDASAFDPGLNDTLTYSWSFGDGASATGQQVRHTYAEDGSYDVSVVVDDGDGGQDRRTLTVSVGAGFEYTVGGDAVGQQRGWIWVRSLVPEFRPDRRNCHVEIRFEPEGQGAARLTALPVFGLSVAARGGLRTGQYDVTGASVTNPGPSLNQIDFRESRPDTFFAGVQAELAQPLPDSGPLFHSFNFTAVGGTVSIDYLDAEWIEGSFSVGPMWAVVPSLGTRSSERFEERHATVVGHFAGALAPDPSRHVRISSPWQAYGCLPEPSETFEIASHTPAAGAENVPFENPVIEVKFTKPVDPDTIFGNLQIDHRMPDAQTGQPEGWPVEGAWELTPGDPYAVRFVPQAHLRDGVIYCVRVRAGPDGVRGTNRERLPAPASPDYPQAYQDPCLLTRIWPQSQEWAISTQVEIENIRADLYQASQAGGDVPLAPEKSTVARVYTHWEPDAAVHPSAQVKRFPARVSVLADGTAVYVPRRVDIVRPDQFTREDKRNARNSINLYGWRPAENGASVGVQAVVEPIDGSGSAVDASRSRVERFSVWRRTEILSFDYYFLNVNGCVPEQRARCDWSHGVDAGWLEKGRQLALAGAEFTTQNFPVIETQARAMGQLSIDEPSHSGPCTSPAADRTRYRCYDVGRPGETGSVAYVGQRLFRAGLNSYADVVVGFVPPGFAIGWTGVMQALSIPGRRIVLIDLDQATADVLAHEFGHFFELEHCPENPFVDTQCQTPHIQGFRVSPSGRSGFNKHELEGNQELASNVLNPLMNWSTNPLVSVFIATNQYRRLFNGITNAPRRQARRAMPLDLRRGPVALLADLLLRPVALGAQGPESEGRLLVGGTVADGHITLSDVRHDAGGGAPPGAEPVGDMTLDQVDAAGRVLRSTPFGLLPDASRSDGPVGGPAAFLLDVPAAPGLHTVRVTGPGGIAAARTRSAQAPAIQAEVVNTSDGPRTLRWSTRDPDGDEVLVSVYVRGDDGDAWRGAAMDTTRTELVLDASHLPAGPRAMARLVAFDGFNTSTTELDLGRGAPLTVVAVAPVTDGTDVPRVTDITAWISRPLATAARGMSVPLPSGRFRLVGPDGRDVFADVTYRPGTGLAMLTPVEPLRPGRKYTATIDGLEDLSGRRLEAPVSWSFVTEGGG